MDINNRVKALREVMKEKKLDAFIIPSSDNHLSEYVGDYFKCREWISGFTGSAGTAVVTLNEAHLWVDGRYYIQAEKQVQGSEYIVEKLGMPNVDNFPKWLCENLSEGDKVGFNGKVMAVSTFDDLQKSLSEKGIEIKVEGDLINQLWKDRPSMPFGKLFILDTKYAGKTALEKINEVREKLSKENVNYTVISSLDDVAWLLNLRGRDIPCNPVFLSYVLLSNDKCTLYIDSKKIDNEIISYLNENSIDVKQYNDIEVDLRKLTSEDKILFDPNKTNVWLNEAISKDIKRKEHRDITTDLKSVKNSIELENLEKCQVKDGIAMVGFIHWLKANIGKIEIDEISASDKLEVFRREMENNLGLSFDSISAYGSNAAMMHYKATEENKSKLEPRGLYLIDSGGQYLEGTTDITRTIVLGDLTEEEKEDFTLVLKGNIGLSRAIFLQGTTGSNLDILARKPIWEKGLDYKCGTGHGVGFLLNVHEGPQRISPQPNNVALKVGMIITNEPGIYKEGKHGIRIENDLVVTKHTETEFGTFFKFDEMSYCPIDLDGIKVEMLTNEEKQWLNTYHKKVYDKLNPYLSDEDLKWLKEATREI